MKANRKFVENEEAVSAVIGVILMVAIAVATAATVFIYTTGWSSSPGEQKENAGVAVKTLSSMIKITLTDSGNNMASTGYTEDQIKILIDGEELDKTHIADLGWSIGESLWIGGDGTLANFPKLEDDKDQLFALDPGTYSITVVIIDTVIYDNPITIA
jgi:hypothetical protein